MKNVNVDGFDFNVPASITGNDLRSDPKYGVRKGDMVVSVRNGQHHIIDDNEVIEDSNVFTMPRYVSGAGKGGTK